MAQTQTQFCSCLIETVKNNDNKITPKIQRKNKYVARKGVYKLDEDNFKPIKEEDENILLIQELQSKRKGKSLTQPQKTDEECQASEREYQVSI